MAHTVIGTAGHIDHGKTLLVKALTGMDTDRTPEEKARGITIELGFAFLGDQATIIDVPGHERFVKTMVAGVSTIDLALLVIAADDGVMPQSREHLDVLELLGVRRGVVALNKVDLVEEEWLELVEQEIRELTRGTFLEGAAIFRVSALTGAGIEALKQRLLDLTAATLARNSDAPFRLPVDRAFVAKGFGLVCTGTVLAGQLREGDAVEVLPALRPARVRSLQQHGQGVAQVQAGDRAAINLAGVEHGQVERGDVLAAPGYLRPSSLLDVRLRLLGSSPQPLLQRTRLRLHLGTREVMARVVLLDQEALKPGQQALAQLRLEAPVAAVWGDRFVVRRYSPPLTIGGGWVLDPRPAKHRRLDRHALEQLKALEQDDRESLVEVRLRQTQERLKPAQELAGELGLGRARVEALVGELERRGRVMRMEVEGQVQALHVQVLQAWAGRLERALGHFHAANPLRAGLRREELRNLGAPHAQVALFDLVLAHLERQGRIAMEGAVVRAATHQIRFAPKEEALRQQIEEQVRTATFAQIPDADGLARGLGAERQVVEAVLGALQSLGKVVALEGGLLMHAQVLDKVRQQLDAHLRERGQITVAQFRELIGSNRKYALALLGYFDGEGLTLRQGDVRVRK
jgi:selenocysteine-specific elongation factor